MIYRLALASMFALLIASTARANLLTNGSFENGDFNNTDTDTRPEIMRLFAAASNLTGWTIAGDPGIDWMDGTGATVGLVPDGNYSVDLTGLTPSGGTLPSISTQFATTVGAHYRLTFLANRGVDGNTAEVSVGDLLNQGFNGGGPNASAPYDFDLLTFDFTATSTTSTLVFEVTASNGFGPVIDDVSVVLIPEPASLALLGVGGLVALRRRR